MVFCRYPLYHCPGLVWWQRGQDYYGGVQAASDILGLLFFILLFPSMRALFRALFTFPNEYRMLLKVKANYTKLWLQWGSCMLHALSSPVLASCCPAGHHITCTSAGKCVPVCGQASVAVLMLSTSAVQQLAVDGLQKSADRLSGACVASCRSDRAGCTICQPTTLLGPLQTFQRS